MIIKGYKIFKPDWTCRSKQYTCPGEFIEDVEPVVCKCGMHFCPRIIDCLSYYPLEYYPLEMEHYLGGEFLKNKVAIVQADKDDCDMSLHCSLPFYGAKYATSRLKIVKELNDKEIIDELMIELSAAFTVEVRGIMNLLEYQRPCPNEHNSLTQNVLRIAKMICMERMEIQPLQ